MREIRLALPGATDDLYIRHQQVWAALRTQANEGRDFLYRLSSPRLALVRSPRLRQGLIVGDLPPSAIALDFVASDRFDRNKERPVPPDRINEWASQLLRQHGLEPTRLDVVHQGLATGTKAARHDQPAHRIRYGVATLQANIRIIDSSLARSAWRYGVGRGRRFGFGMLVPL